MRGLIAVCVGLVLVLGAGAALGGVAAGNCCICSCEVPKGALFCTNGPVDQDQVVEACGRAADNAGGEKCSLRCPPSASNPACASVELCDGVTVDLNPHPAPTASPYGIAALLIALGGFGAWRLRKRAA